jgi:hypothetical protein
MKKGMCVTGFTIGYAGFTVEIKDYDECRYPSENARSIIRATLARAVAIACFPTNLTFA